MPHATTSPPPTQSSRRTPSRAITVQNRRIRYLSQHPEYFTSPDLELSNPLLYDRLIRRFQSAAEREAQGRARGFASSMEADLVRGEAKLEALNHATGENGQIHDGAWDGEGIELDVAEGSEAAELRAITVGGHGEIGDDGEDEDSGENMVYLREADGSITEVEREPSARPQSREEAWERWMEIIGRRFVQGHDAEFEYETVDDDAGYDDAGEEEREELEAYLEDEDERYVGEGMPQGETGVQDF